MDRRWFFATAVAVWATCGASNAQQGVDRAEVLVGTIQDLSGPIAALGKQARNGMQLRIDEVNEQGGVHGRRIRMIVEDNGYDPRKALQAAQKLVNRDKVFAVLGHIGTAQNNAAMPIQFEKGVINWLPITAAREMYEPLNRLKFASFATYYDQMRAAIPELHRRTRFERACIIYQDDEFGLEVLRGAEWAMRSIGKDFAEKTSYKRGATDFTSQVARSKAARCDLVVLGTIIRETIGTVNEARKTGFAPVFVAPSSAYSELIHKLGGKSMDGLYAMHTAGQPYLDSADAKVRFWATKYRTQFTEDPTVFSAYGYSIVDMFVAALRAAGPNLTVDGFVRAAESTSFPPDMFGSPAMRFSPTARLGNDQSRMSQIVDGRWAPVTDYLKVPAER